MSILRCVYVSFVLPLALAVMHIRQGDVGGSIRYEMFKVDSTIVARYASTSFSSTILNAADTSQELSFQVQLPDTAFISNFTMSVNDTTYVGIADEKQKAADTFNERQQAGENVGLVESRGTNLFLIRINTAASSRSTFVLEYEELLIRRLAAYQQVINLNPGSRVNDLRVSVRVLDDQGISNFKTSDFATARRVSDNEVVYTYSPSLADQGNNDFGLSRDMLVEFDVNHPPGNGAGSVIVNDCHFAHFFSPTGVSTIPVDIVFVIDTSGSMSGTKISQARESLVVVISQLRDEDYFTIVRFSSTTSSWENNLVSVAEFRENGKEFAQSLEVSGGTFFNGGMEVGIEILKRSGNENYVQLLIMLTDGEPTVGVTDPHQIVELASELLANTRISLNTLGFGTNLNFLLLQRLAIGNRGIAKKIFEGQDAAKQLEGFYEEISSPILQSVVFSYPMNIIEDISDVEFPLLFKGSEVVVAGKFVDDVCVSDSTPITVVVRGMGSTAEQTFQSQVNPAMQTEVAGVRPSTERLAAYLTIKQLLDTLKVTTDDDLTSSITQNVLDLALSYNFVTELTSLIVVEESYRNNISSADYRIGDVLNEGDLYSPGFRPKISAPVPGFYDLAAFRATGPAGIPAFVPASVPESVPESVPTHIPTSVPTHIPTSVPTHIPTSVPTHIPTSVQAVVPASFLYLHATAASATASSSIGFVVGLALAAVFLTASMNAVIIVTVLVYRVKGRAQSSYRMEAVNRIIGLTASLERKQKEEGNDLRSVEKDEKGGGEIEQKEGGDGSIALTTCLQEENEEEAEGKERDMAGI